MELFLGILFFLGTPALIISGIVELCNNNLGAGLPCLIIGLSLLVVLIFSFIPSKEKREAKRNEKQRLAQEQINQYNQLATNIYNKCIEKGVNEIGTQESLKALQIIAANYGVKDLEIAKGYFEKGKQLIAEQERIKREEEIKKYREEDENLYKKQLNLTKTVGKAKYSAMSVGDKLTDEFDTLEKFKLLEFTDVKYEKTSGGNLRFECNIKVNGTPEILGSPAVLDGSVKVTVFKNGVEVGEGYICAEGFDGYPSGFRPYTKYTCICLIETLAESAGKVVEDQYTFTFSPVALWFIEK